MNKNKNSKIMLVLSILLLFLIIGSASAADETSNEKVSTTTNNDGVDTLNTDGASVDERVSTTEDNLGSDNTEVLKDSNTGTFKELNQTIYDPANKGIIKLTKDYEFDKSTDSGFENGILIKNSVTINGLGHSISGNGLARIFNITGNDVILKDLVIKNGNANTYGAIISTGSNNQIIRCTFDNNTATQDYILYTSSTNGIISDTIFTNNKARQYLVTADASNFKISKCTFDNNTGTSGRVLLFKGYEGIFEYCKFINNHASQSLVHLQNSYLKMNNNIFENNNNTNYLLNVEADVDIENCIFNNNSASEDFLICMNSARLNGESGRGSINLINCTFSNNYASHGIIQVKENNGLFNNSKFINNTGINYGMFDGNVPMLGFFNLYFYNNTGKYVISYRFYLSPLRNCTFIKNNATVSVLYLTGNIFDSTFEDNTGVKGGAIYLDGAYTVNNCKFKNNNATNGGAIYAVQNRASIVDCEFNDNTALNGGAIYNTKDYLIVQNTTFNGNNATINGGAIFSTGNWFSEINCTFNHNNAHNNSENMYLPEGINAYIDVTVGVNSSNIINSPIVYYVNSTNDTDGSENEITLNYALSHIASGGTIYIPSGTYLRETSINLNNKKLNLIGQGKPIITVSHSQTPFFINFNSYSNVKNILFTGNNDLSNTRGSAGICSEGGIQHVYFVNCTFNDTNTFKFSGRNSYLINCTFQNMGVTSISVYYRTTFAINCTFKNNKEAIIAYPDQPFNSVSSNVDCINCTFINNTVTQCPYIVNMMGDDSKITGCVFINNTIPTTPGGILSITAQNVLVDDCTFINNTAVTGSGVYIHSSARSITVSNSGFYNNTAVNGTVFAQDMNYVNIINSIFINNTADNGAGIYSKSNRANLDNCTIVNNTANTNGGAIYNNGNQVTITGGSISNNTAENGGALYNNGTSTKVSGVTFNNNTASGDGGSIFMNNGSDISIDKTTFVNSSTNEVYLSNDTDLIFDQSSTEGLNDSSFAGDTSNYQSTLSEIFVSDTDTASEGTMDKPTSLSNALTRIAENGVIKIINNTNLYISNIVDISKDFGFSIIGLENVVVYDPLFTINAPNIHFNNITFKSSSLSDDAFVWNNVGGGSFTNCKFMYEGTTGGNIKFMNIEGKSFILDNCTFSGFKTKNILFTSLDDVIIRDCLFTSNLAQNLSNDVLVDILGSDTQIIDTNFTHNRVKLININSLTSNVKINGGYYYNNTIGNGYLVSLKGSNNYIEGVCFVNNTADSVICVNGTSLSITGNLFENNTGLDGAALIVLSNSQITLDNNRFINNSARDGAVNFKQGCKVDSFKGNVFYDNDASGKGGAIYSEVDLNVNDAVFNGNSADSGDVIYSNGKVSFDDYLINNGQSIVLNGGYSADVIYVSSSGSSDNYGLSWDSPTTLENAALHLADNVKIIFTDNNENIINNIIKFNNTVIIEGNGSTLRTNNKDKSLFNNCLTSIKSCS